jgi:thioredoxin 1
MKSVFYFTADWCNPCKRVKPIVEELNREQTEANFQIIDVDIEMELAKSFQVKSVPTFILMKDGIEINRITGAQTRDSLIGFING